MKPVILDIGTGCCKIGFADERKPRYCYPSIVGRMYDAYVSQNNFSKNLNALEFGEKAFSNKIFYNISYPIKNGVVQDREGFIKLCEGGFKFLNINPSVHPVLLTDSSSNSTKSREEKAEIMFEHFNVPYFYIDYQTSFALLASGRMTGLVVEIGDGITQILPSFMGYSLKKGICQLEFGGKDITEWLQRDLQNGEINSRKHLENVRKIKEEHCYVAFDYEKEKKSIREKNYTVSGYKFSMKEQQISAPELLFQPKMNTGLTKGVHELVKESIQSCDEKERKILYENIVISGGTSAFRGLSERLTKELQILSPDQKVNVSSIENPAGAVWRGAAMFSRPPCFCQIAVSRVEYNEKRERIIQEKCFACID